MNSYHNLDPSLFRHDASSTPQNDMLREYQRQASQEMTQSYEFHRPPGAESMGSLSPPTQPGPTRLPLQESLPLGHAELGEHANNRILSPFSMDVQADGSNNVIYSSSPSRSISLSPSHSYPSRVPMQGMSQLLRCLTATESEPKDSGTHLSPSCRLILQVVHLGGNLTLTSELCRNHLRSPRQSWGTEMGLLTTLAPFKWPLHLRSSR